jgi:GDP/UDP-N,N'-diacetylbacillosamine 2-epimerase (hydrolysing)
MKKNKICVVTGSRADYGLLVWVMKAIEAKDNLQLVPVATGAHLEKKWGHTVDAIVADGFTNVVKINSHKGATTPHGIALSMAECIKNFSEYFKDDKPDMLVLLGDRHEILAVALASLPYNIPIAHLGGGEVSEGAIDDSIRHALTKLSHLHFAITEKCAERIIKMGEEPWRVHAAGSPRLDFTTRMKYKSKEELGEKLGIDFSGKTALVIFHPSTLENKSAEEQTDELIKALASVDCYKIIFYPNIDVNSDVIISKLEDFCKERHDAKLFLPLEMEDYLSLLNSVDILIGNSSAGIVEAPSFRLPVVNVGNRQKGRDCMSNVIHAGNDSMEIAEAISKGLNDKDFIASLSEMKNIYGDGRASEKIADIISSVDFKKFTISKKNCLG